MLDTDYYIRAEKFYEKGYTIGYHEVQDGIHYCNFGGGRIRIKESSILYDFNGNFISGEYLGKQIYLEDKGD